MPDRRPEPVALAVRAWLGEHLSRDEPVIVACSGGADSLALALAVRAAVDAADGSRRVAAATVDHGLQVGSAQRAQSTAELLERIGYGDIAVLTVAVEGSGGMEAAARRTRYAALAAHARSVFGSGHGPLPGAVLVGHTGDDQAETVLLGLARGSGPRSIAGMRPWRPPWGRPLLTMTRADTENACRAAGLSPWQDPHNADPAFTRVRLRREVLPLLEDVLGGGVRAALSRTADLMAEDLDALAEIAVGARARVCDADGALDIALLRGYPAAIRGRVLRSWASAGGAGPLTFEHLTRMGDAVSDPKGPAQVRIPGGLDVVRTGNTLRLRHIRPASEH
jgi:tRNA(Ile)-lysidine synthase